MKPALAAALTLDVRPLHRDWMLVAARDLGQKSFVQPPVPHLITEANDQRNLTRRAANFAALGLAE